MLASIQRRHWVAAFAAILAIPLFRYVYFATVSLCSYRAAGWVIDLVCRQIPRKPLPPVVLAIPGNWGMASKVYWVAASTDRRHAPGCRYYRRVPGRTAPAFIGRACGICGG